MSDTSDHAAGETRDDLIARTLMLKKRCEELQKRVADLEEEGRKLREERQLKKLASPDAPFKV